MRKIFVLFVAIAFGFLAATCSSDDNRIATVDYPTAIKGIWEESSIIYLDQNKKFIKQIDAFNIHNCPLNQIEITDSLFIEHLYYQYDHNDSCQKRAKTHTFILKEDQIETEFFGSDYIELTEYEIISVTNSKLILQHSKYSWQSPNVPENAEFTKVVYRKK